MAFYTPLLAHNGYDIVMLKATSSPTTDGNWSEQDGSVRVETGGGKVKSLWASEGNSQFIYHFDTSDAGPTDNDGVWTTDADAFDADRESDAGTSTVGTETTNELRGEGTNAPGSGGTIDSVRINLRASGLGDGSIRVYTDGEGESLLNSTITLAALPGDFELALTVPSGGWTYAKIQALEVILWLEGTGIDVQIVEVIVVTQDQSIYIATQQETDGRVRLHIFDPGTDTWTTKNEFVAEIGDHANFDSVPILHGCSLAVRSDGDIVVVFVGHDDTGGDDEVFCVSKTTTWGSVQSVSNDAENPVAIGPDSSDRITFVYGDVGASDVDTRSINSSDALGTEVSLDDAADTALLIVGPGIIDSGNEIYVPFIDGSNKVSVKQFTSAADPTGDITNHDDISDTTVWRHSSATSPETLQATDTNATEFFGKDGVGSGDPSEAAQSFKFAATTKFDTIEIFPRKFNSPTDNVVVEIQSDSSGSPDGTALFTSDTIDGASLTTVGAPLDVTFPGPVHVDAGVTYWIVFKRSGSLDSTNYYALGGSISSVYSDGLAKKFHDGAWETGDSLDIYFIITSDVPVSNAFCLAIDGTDVHLLYSDNDTGDIFHDSDVDGGGTTDVELDDAVSSYAISCAVLGTNLDYVWLDGTTIKYNSIDIAGAAPAFLPNGLMLVGVGR